MDLKPNISCTVCGENDFHLKEGYYYCNECGTKTEQVRALEVERDDEFEDARNRKTLKIKKIKSDKPELTSWECYNYILRGIVEELLEMGAKDELKLMTLQVWAAYLRFTEVAFFSKRHPELPKLGPRFERRDANILYNHALERKKVKLEEKTNTSIASSKREWKKQMKKFDQSQYEASLSQSFCSTSILSQSSFGDTSGNSSGSAPTNRAIQLKFSTKARKHLKKRMPSAHLKKHEKDFDNSLTCHKIRCRKSELTYSDTSMDLNMKQLYAIVAVALNLIEDDIQLTDFMRFIAEGHISSLNVEHFFPDNISHHCKEALESFRFHNKFTQFSVAQMRLQASLLCKGIHIRSLKRPDILKIIQRNITELCLPFDIYIYIERLINLHPPKMEWEGRISIPCYESRAMAYIIFTLKLLFGLDGRKEKLISRSAKKVNAQLTTMALEGYDELFVWDDWVEYIEMRKVILCNHSFPICKQFKQVPSRKLYLQNLSERAKPKQVLSKDQKKRQQNMEIVFENFLKTNTDEKPTDIDGPVKLGPSFTPCYNSFKRLQLDPKIDATIPNFMRVDHSKRTIQPLLKPTKLKELFAKCGRKLNVIHVSCTDKRNLTGTFRNRFLNTGKRNPRKVHLDDDQNAWEAKVMEDKPDESIFKPYMEKYSTISLKIMERKRRKAQYIQMSMDTEIPANEDISCTKSIDLFQEDDMDPADVHLTAPRRHLESINIFTDVSDDENRDIQEQDNTLDDTATTKLKISNMDCWLLMGKASELTEVQSIELKGKLPLTFLWLLEICANTLGVDWTELYDQLLVLETFFAYVIQPLNQFEDRIIFKEQSEIKDINKIVHHFKAGW